MAGRSDCEASDSALRLPPAFGPSARGAATILKTRRPAGGVGEVSAAVLGPASELGRTLHELQILADVHEDVASRVAARSPCREVGVVGQKRAKCARTAIEHDSDGNGCGKDKRQGERRG